MSGLADHWSPLVWPLMAAPLILLALAAALYINGVIRLYRASDLTLIDYRHGLFFLGLGLLFVALQSPLAAMSERLFSIHQLQILVLRMLGPMLLVLARPAAVLSAGFPGTLRENIPVGKAVAARPTQGERACVPAAVTILYIMVLYFWEIPALHDLAVAEHRVHLLMEATMLCVGLLFWALIFDRRQPRMATDLDLWDEEDRLRSQHGLAYGGRLMMLCMVVFSNIMLGAYTTLKTDILYSAYDTPGRLFGYAPIADQQVGGVVIWILSSFICVLAVLVVLRLLGRHEAWLDEQRLSQQGSNSATLLYPATGEALIQRARAKNKAMAVGCILFVITAFATTVLVGILFYLSTVSNG